MVVSLSDDEDIDYGGYELDLIRQRQKVDREKIEKYAKIKKRVNKISKKNRVTKRK